MKKQKRLSLVKKGRKAGKESLSAKKRAVKR